MTKTEAIKKLLRVQRYLLDRKDFAGFDVVQKCFLQVVAEIKADAKARAREIKSLVEDSGYSRAEAVKLVDAGF